MTGCTLINHRLFSLLAAGAALVSLGSPAWADLIAGDSFVMAEGAYKPGNLTAQPEGGTAPSSFGFSETYGSTPTSFLVPDKLTLNSSATGYKGAVGGSIRLASNANAEGVSRSLTRPIEKSDANPTTLYFSGLLQAPKALTANRGGFFEFGNRRRPGSPPSFLGESALHKGFEIGIQGSSFVVRTAGGKTLVPYSSTFSPSFGANTAATNLFVARLDVKPSGNDILVVYVNPTDVTSEEKARETSPVTLEFNDRDIVNRASDISNAGFRTLSLEADQTPIFADEIRIGTSFSAVVAPVP